MTTDADTAAELGGLADDVWASLSGHHPPQVRAHLQGAERQLRMAAQYYAQRAREAADRGTGARGRWYILESAVRAYHGMQETPRTLDACERQITDLSREATLRDTDAQGRQLWRVGRPHRVRFVVDPRPRPEGDLPVLLWAGKGRPPGWCWEQGSSEE